MPKLKQSKPPTVEVIHGDCREVLQDYPDRHFDFVFADPPFNVGQKYRGYHDLRSDYREFTQQWINQVVRVANGVIALHGNDDCVFLFNECMRHHRLKRIAWVNWHYRFGQCGRGNWIDSRAHCLLYRVHKTHTWNPESVLVDSDRALTGDKRINDSERGGKRVPFTVWGIPSDGENWGRVQGNNKERRHSHPNQLPEVYLKRLILAYTNQGDSVLDPFAGSGTTATVAKSLGRTAVTIDVSGVTVASVKERLEIGAIRV